MLHFSSSSLFIGKPTIEFQSIDSTNTYAMDLIAQSKPSEGTTIISQVQTDGKGQYGRNWHSEEGKNLMLSIILKPSFLSVTRQFDLTILTAVSLTMLLESYVDKNISIKWPNDIYVNKKKVCGVLIQNTTMKKHIQYSVIGIGLNVNQIKFPPELPNPTSIKNEVSENINTKELRERLFSLFEANYLIMKSKGINTLKKEYTKRLYLRNEASTFLLSNEEVITGKIIDVDDNGKLIMEMAQGRKTYQMSELKYIH